MEKGARDSNPVFIEYGDGTRVLGSNLKINLEQEPWFVVAVCRFSSRHRGPPVANFFYLASHCGTGFARYVYRSRANVNILDADT